MPAKTIAHVGPRLKGHIIFVLCLQSFATILSSTLQPEALIQLFEDAICKEMSEMRRHPGPTRTGYEFCQSPLVHDEVALVYRVYKAIPAAVAMLCAIPYGIYASGNSERRKSVLILNGIAASLAFAWILAICYFRALSTRSIWLSGMALLVGGGDTVALSLVYAMVTDVVAEEERSKIFLLLQGSEALGTLWGLRLGPLITMAGGGIWVVPLLTLGAMFARVEIARSLPGNNGFDSDDKGGFRARRPLRSLLTTTSQVILLLLMFICQAASRDVFSTIGLRYLAAKFTLPFDSASTLHTFVQNCQCVCTIGVVPMIARVVSSFVPWNFWPRDRNFTICFIAFTALGTLIMGFTEKANAETVGLVLVVLGRCVGPFILSLLAGVARPEQIGIVYSVAIMGGMVGSHVAEPVFHALLIGGMKWGGGWIGLPFDVVAGSMAVVLLASLFVKRRAGNEL
ncbi:major facilitator superfamily domain-containing protein [Aspergillus filifer]